MNYLNKANVPESVENLTITKKLTMCATTILFRLFPVHGGWSGWSAWGGCPVTCGAGLERRDRACTNPRPALFGDHCFGDSHEDRICGRQSCTETLSRGKIFRENEKVLRKHSLYGEIAALVLLFNGYETYNTQLTFFCG